MSNESNKEEELTVEPIKEVEFEKETGESTTEVMMEEKEAEEMNEDVFDEGLLEEVVNDNKREGQNENGIEFTGLDGKTYKLSLKQQMFCLAYLEEKGCGVEAIIKAGYEVRYKDDKGEYIPNAYNRKLAAVMAYELLKKPHITSFINTKLEEYGFTDENVDKQSLFLINQYADLKVKKSAIDSYNKLKGRITDKHDFTSGGEKILGIQIVRPEGAKDVVKNGESNTTEE